MILLLGLSNDPLNGMSDFGVTALRPIGVTSRRKIAGARTGSATEIVEALLKEGLHVRVMNLERASVADQIAWYHAADVVIGMHGARG